MNVIVCRARQYNIRRIRLCPTCKTRRRMLWQDEVWYGITTTCCHCGDSWQDGELYPRPTKRGWRKEAAAKATAEWLAVGRYDPAAHRAWAAAQTGDADAPATEPPADTNGWPGDEHAEPGTRGWTL